MSMLTVTCSDIAQLQGSLFRSRSDTDLYRYMGYPKSPDPFSHLQPLYLAYNYDRKGKEIGLTNINVYFPIILKR